MKRINITETSYSEKQKKLDDLYFALSTQRYRYIHYYNGTIIYAVKDEECVELIAKIEDTLKTMKEVYEKSLKRSTWENGSEYVILVDMEAV